MSTSWDRLDHEVEQGVITKETIQHFRDAELYGTAPPMEWLTMRLGLLVSILSKGNTISIQINDTEFQEVRNLDAFCSWLEITLPQAFKGLTQKSTIKRISKT